MGDAHPNSVRSRSRRPGPRGPKRPAGSDDCSHAMGKWKDKGGIRRVTTRPRTGRKVGRRVDRAAEVFGGAVLPGGPDGREAPPCVQRQIVQAIPPRYVANASPGEGVTQKTSPDWATFAARTKSARLWRIVPQGRPRLRTLPVGEGLSGGATRRARGRNVRTRETAAPETDSGDRGFLRTASAEKTLFGGRTCPYAFLKNCPSQTFIQLSKKNNLKQ